MNIKINNLIISLNLNDYNVFNNLSNYLKKEDAKYFIKSMNNEIGIKGNLIGKNKYYSLYKYEDKYVQDQYNIGQILYDNNYIYIYTNKGPLCEYMLSEYGFKYLIEKYLNGILFHSSSIIYNNKCILFTGNSGSGKSTIRKKFELLGAKTINDDKNIIILEDDIYIYPNPYSGKEKKDNNIYHKLDYIIFLNKDNDNKLIKLDLNNKLSSLIKIIGNPIFLNKDHYDKLLDKLLNIKMYNYYSKLDDNLNLLLEELWLVINL